MKLSELYRKGLGMKRKLLHPFCTAVIVAAGNGTRMGGTDKMLVKIAGRSVICRTLEAFDRHPLIDEIIVAAREDQLDEISRLCSHFEKVTMVVRGGENRMESVAAGLGAVQKKTKIVAVHDGARPLVTEEVITKAVEKAAKFGAAAPAIPVKDTIKVSLHGSIDATPKRKNLYAVQTPQCFDADLLRAALENARAKNLSVTDDCSAVEAIGMKVNLTDGSEENLKITTALDLQMAELILKKRAEA